jgi:hypothetical protein
MKHFLILAVVALWSLFTVICLPTAFGATCPDTKHLGVITALALVDDVDANATLSLRWREKFMDAITDSSRYCFLFKRAGSDVVVSISAIDTDPSNFAIDRVAVSTVAYLPGSGQFIGHQLQLCSPRTVEDCAKQALTHLDNQILKLPEEKPKN